MKLHRKILAVCLLPGLALASSVQAATLEDVEQTFYPYKFETPDAGALLPGVVVTKDNVDSVARTFSTRVCTRWSRMAGSI